MPQRPVPLVLKVGTNALSSDDGTIDYTKIAGLVRQLAEVTRLGFAPVLVSSGAVGAGRKKFPNLQQTQPEIAQKQVWAAIGQIELMKIYELLFGNQGIPICQVLVTRSDFNDRKHYLNIRNVLQTALKNTIVPILNENDTVSVTELMFTDNDELAGLTATMLEAEKLIILTNVDGIYTGHPNNPDVQLIETIHPSSDIEQYIAPIKSSFGRGGMATKYGIAKQIAKFGVTTHIGNGNSPDIILKIIQGKAHCTTVVAAKKTAKPKQNWIQAANNPKAKIYINDLASDILKSPDRIASLLPVGITKIEGEFEKGDLIEIIGSGREKIGYGLAQYDSSRAQESLGLKNQKPLIHYNYLVIE